ncbi:MAG: hypothetical protein FGM58_04270 [Acidimicrobiia bacterium]|nr:hypothetical protein [Acidimicrobiia bacterium]
MPITNDAVATAVDEAGVLLRADGADLHLVGFDVDAASVRVAVDISGSNCVECIIPPDLLAVMLTDAINRSLDVTVEVVVDDPRRDDPSLGISADGSH